MYMGVSSYNRTRTQTSQWETPGMILGFKSLASAVTHTLLEDYVRCWEFGLKNQ